MPASSAVVPADSEELYRVYYGYVRSLVRRRPGLPAQEVDDITSEIMTRILERDVLGMFDPAKHIEYQGSVVPPNFRTFLSGIVLRYVRGQHDKFGRRLKHETLLCDAPAGDNVSWVELFGGHLWDDYPSLTDAGFVTRMRTYLAMVPPRTPRDSLNLVELFDELLTEVVLYGKTSPKAVRDHFGISLSTAQNWLGYLREKLEPLRSGETLASREPLVVSGVLLTMADAQSALKILSSGEGGMMVKGPLAAHGHPLSVPEANVKGHEWYHAIDKAERKMFPALNIPPVSKGAAYRCRGAVIHWLERILTDAGHPLEAPEPEPEEEPTPREKLEAELWTAGLSPQRVDRCLALADAMVMA